MLKKGLPVGVEAGYEELKTCSITAAFIRHAVDQGCET